MVRWSNSPRDYALLSGGHDTVSHSFPAITPHAIDRGIQIIPCLVTRDGENGQWNVSQSYTYSISYACTVLCLWHSPDWRPKESCKSRGREVSWGAILWRYAKQLKGGWCYYPSPFDDRFCSDGLFRVAKLRVNICLPSIHQSDVSTFPQRETLKDHCPWPLTQVFRG